MSDELLAGYQDADEDEAICVVDGEGSVVRPDVVASDPDLLVDRFRRMVPAESAGISDFMRSSRDSSVAF